MRLAELREQSYEISVYVVLPFPPSVVVQDVDTQAEDRKKDKRKEKMGDAKKRKENKTKHTAKP